MSASPTVLDSNDQAFEPLRCPCGSWSHLGLDPIEVSCDGILIAGSLPSLICDDCGIIRIPYNVKVVLSGMSKKAKQEGSTTVKVNIKGGTSAKKRFPFCRGLNLKYDPLDYFYIPGLERPFNSGFLTPVFFSIEILPYFQNHPGYIVNFASDTYGTLYTKDRGYISFGLNLAKSLIMWLGDLDELSQQDLLMLAAHNIESDHNIGSEFYEAQVEAQFTKRSQEQRIIRAQSRFAAELIEKHGALRLLKMDKEAVELLANLRRPIYFSNEEFGASMEVMTKLLIERIDVEQLRANLKSVLSVEEAKEAKSYQGMRLLQLWLEKRLLMGDSREIMTPLFVLYDLRVAYKHLLPSAKKEEYRNSSISRLGLKDNATLEELYVCLTESIEKSFDRMAKASAHLEV